MASKIGTCVLSKSNQGFSMSNNDNQFINLYLNQNHKSSDLPLVCSKNESYHNNKSNKNDLSDSNTFDEPAKESHCYSSDKNDSHFILLDYLNDSCKEETQSHLKSNNYSGKTHNSTLSLHISAYENNTKTDNLIDKKEYSSDKGSTGKMIDSEKFRHDVTVESANAMFEIPRQQKDESTEPEIMQFKASQKMIDPNHSCSSKIEFEKLKEKANKLFQEKKYNEAIKAYTDILQLPTLSSENQAVIYSNRSASYVLLGNSLDSAKIDAEKAIKCWPSWSKGYFRLARVLALQTEFQKAQEALTQALALTSEIDEITAGEKDNKELLFDSVLSDEFSKLSHGMPMKRKNPLDYEKFGKCVQEAAKNGSSTAQRHMEIWKNFNNTSEPFKKRDSKALVAALSAAIRLNPQIVCVPEVFKQLIEITEKGWQEVIYHSLNAITQLINTGEVSAPKANTQCKLALKIIKDMQIISQIKSLLKLN